ncbi:ImmA/IrrE family metallo-endopeptidase [Candidatus Palauibacter sp.]|uniref:ImmA/IrrE family metallo-endopeptidase n=1 Tax=Candidatus Palauibacter sp. TaxID=3101350 RepID=UPI003B5AEF50
MKKVIRTKAEYDAAYGVLLDLMGQDPEPGSRTFERLELLTVLLKAYEAKNVEVGLPDPVEAIRFRMEQQNLRQRDLIPYLGSRSKVSEVLSGKRGLSLAMARALHTGLGIPAAVLLQKPDQFSFEGDGGLDWERFPVRHMTKRGWLPAGPSRGPLRKVLRTFFAPVGTAGELAALYRSSAHVRSARTMDIHSLLAWSARIVTRSLDDPPRPYQRGTVTCDFLRAVAQVSRDDEGPLRAVEFLYEHGVSVIIEPHLPSTYLDGAAIMRPDFPIVGLTLRHDRIDNFWFTLIHELAHIALHPGQTAEFFDDLDVDDQGDPREAEADALAGEVLIPNEEWNLSPARRLRTPEAAEHLANRLRIHVAIVAGKMRFESDSYHKLSHMVGQGKVRRLFSNLHWD